MKVKDFAAANFIGINRIKSDIRSGACRAIRSGKTLLITVEDGATYLRSFPTGPFKKPTNFNPRTEDAK